MRWPHNLRCRRNLLVGYGALADLLGARLSGNLGDAQGAEAAFAKASEIAYWIRDRAPADRRAIFDIVNVKLRLGTLLADDQQRIGGALREFEEAARLNGLLLAQEPGSNRYGYTGLALERRTGETLIKLGRHADAAHRLETVRSSAPRFLAGPNGPAARLQLVLATVSLACAPGAEIHAHTRWRCLRRRSWRAAHWTFHRLTPPRMGRWDAFISGCCRGSRLAMAAISSAQR